MTIAEYEQKFTEMAKYVIALVLYEEDNCKEVDEGLRTEIQTPITASAYWLNFHKMVDAVMRVEGSLAEKEDKSWKRGQVL